MNDILETLSKFKTIKQNNTRNCLRNELSIGKKQINKLSTEIIIHEQQISRHLKLAVNC